MGSFVFHFRVAYRPYAATSLTAYTIGLSNTAAIFGKQPVYMSPCICVVHPLHLFGKPLTRFGAAVNMSPTLIRDHQVARAQLTTSRSSSTPSCRLCPCRLCQPCPCPSQRCPLRSSRGIPRGKSWQPRSHTLHIRPPADGLAHARCHPHDGLICCNVWPTTRCSYDCKNVK